MPLRVYVWMYRIFSYTQAVRVGLLVRLIYTTEYNSYVYVCMYVYYNLCCCFNCFCCSLICCTVFMCVYIYPKSHFSSAHLFSDHSSIHLLSSFMYPIVSISLNTINAYCFKCVSEVVEQNNNKNNSNNMIINSNNNHCNEKCNCLYIASSLLHHFFRAYPTKKVFT